MRYRDLKQERDDAIARAVEAERMSMKSEFDRVTREFEEEKARLRVQARESETESYWRGFNDGLDSAEKSIARLPRASALVQAEKELLTKSPEEAFCERLYESGIQKRKNNNETKNRTET
jgi:hypothetical protein